MAAESGRGGAGMETTITLVASARPHRPMAARQPVAAEYLQVSGVLVGRIGATRQTLGPSAGARCRRGGTGAAARRKAICHPHALLLFIHTAILSGEPSEHYMALGNS